MHPKKIVYITSSAHKRKESEYFIESRLANGKIVKDVVHFDFRSIAIKEVLDVDLSVIVSAEVLEAYQLIQVPCIVEHAGLIYDDYVSASYPGGLTKAMWNALKADFVKETNANNRKVIARAVVGYCNGMTIETFTGETRGTISATPKGLSDFYWDTIFIPDDPNGISQGSKTYAEIAADPALGIAHKVSISQSTKAMRAFVDYLTTESTLDLWR